MTEKNKARKGLISTYSRLLDSIDKEFNLTTTDMTTERLSSGLCCVDLVLGGGYSYGFHVLSGQEQSGKSTLATHFLADSLKKDVPVRILKDAEGTTEPTYSGNIYNRPIKDVFGERDKKGGWIIYPQIRYSDSNVLETVFNSVIKVVNRLPNKIYRSDRNQWYYVLEPRDKRTEHFLKALGPYDKGLKSQTGSYWFPAESSVPQAIIVIDSLPSLITENVDDKEEKQGGMALNARAFSEILPRIIGKLSKKNVIILAINQVREKPGVSFGNPIYEPGGNSIKFYSRSRNQIFARSVPQEWKSANSSSALCIEKSLLGDGFDEFAFKHLRNVKNKMGSPFLDCWTRVWVKDYNNEGRGFDLAFDSWNAFRHAKLATELKVKGNRILKFGKMPKELIDLQGKEIDWNTFRLMIQSQEKNAPRELKDKALKANKLSNLPIRRKLQKVINKGDLQYHSLSKKSLES